jgi:hypothetical protein
MRFKITIYQAWHVQEAAKSSTLQTHMLEQGKLKTPAVYNDVEATGGG